MSATKKESQPTGGAIIVAAGTSRRMAGDDKLFALLGGEPVLARVVDVFEGCNVIGQIVIVVREEILAEARRMLIKYGWKKAGNLVVGGKRRQDSVMAGLKRLNNCEWVVVHDAARPLVTAGLIKRGLRVAVEAGAAVAAVPVTDTIKVAGSDQMVRYTPVRKTLWAVQTPQIFRKDIITEAYRQAKGEVTDDAALVEQLGHRV